MSYKDLIYTALPPWLQAGSGKPWAYGMGEHQDQLLTDMKTAVKARFPTYAAAAGDKLALSRLGTDRALPRYPGESDAQYGDRLLMAWEIHEKEGVEQSILTDLEGAGFGDITLMEYRDWPAAASPANAHESPDGILDALGNPWWSRFWIYIGSYNGASIPSGAVMGTGVMGTDVMGVSLDIGTLNSVKQSGISHKPAHTLFCQVGWLLDGTTAASIMGMAVMGASTMGPGAGDGVNYQAVYQ